MEIIDFNESVFEMLDQMQQNDLEAVKRVELIKKYMTSEIFKVSIIIEKDSVKE